MTTIHFSGKSFIGAGLLCREPGDYTVSDSTADRLIRDHAHLFSLADDQPETPEDTQGDDDTQTGEVTGEGDTEASDATSTPESGESTSDVARDPETGSEAGEAPETDTDAKTKPVSKMNKTELEALAAEVGAEVNGEMTADEMRQAIKAAQAE